MPDARRRFLPGALLALLVLVLDRASKEMLVPWLSQEGPYRVTPFFDLVMIWNRGVSFGLFQQHQDLGRVVLIVFSLAVAVALAVWLYGARSLRLAAGLGLVIGGAVGNAYDRLAWGAVADFFDFHLSGVHFWAFNVADAGITLGVILLLLDSFLAGRKE